MAGAEGLEPTNGGIKTRCLTTWRRPWRSNSCALARDWKQIKKRRAVDALCDKSRQIFRRLRQHMLCFFCGIKRGEHARSCSSHSSITGVLAEPIQSFVHGGIKPSHQCLAVVSTTLLEKGRYCNVRRVSCQIFVGKNFSGRNMAIRTQDNEPFLRHFNCLQTLTDTLGPGGSGSDKYRTVRAQFYSQRM